MWPKSSGDNFTTEISEKLHIGNIKEVYRSTNRVNYIKQRLKHSDRCTGLDNMEETLMSLARQGWNNIVSANAFNLLTASDKRRNTGRAHRLCLQHCQNEQLFRHMSPQVYHLREIHVHGVCRSINLASLGEASKDVGIHNFGQLFHVQTEQHWWLELCGLVLAYD